MIDATTSQAVLDWFASKGITPETVADFGIRVDPDGAVVFPYGDLAKKRYGIPKGERSFRWSRGVDPILYNRRDLGKPRIFLVEGETDTMRLRQEIGEREDVGVVGLPGIETWNQGMANDLRSAERVWVILDNDLDYRVAGRVDECYRAIRASLGRKAKRIVLPRGINDLCEFFEDHSLDALRLLVERRQSHQSRFRTLSLTVPPTPPKWVIDRLLCRGDVHILIGEPNIGKSFVTMDMAVAIAGVRDAVLGHSVVEQGPVLYIDEENPEDLIIDRFKRLGLTEEAADNIRYISNAGIRLDKDPDALLDEAIDLEPVLIVLDSLTRLHGQDENASGPMSALFNDAIVPLARQTGAAVLVIHHVNKTDSTSSFKRARGSSDITAAVDSGYDMYKVEDGTLRIKNFKARRAAQVSTIYADIVDRPDGGIAVVNLSGFSGAF
jgi:hypothetical protein